jgi:hypothetical protein
MPAVRAFLNRVNAAEYLEGKFIPVSGETLPFEAVEHSQRSELFCKKLIEGLPSAFAKETEIEVGETVGDITVLHSVDFESESAPAREYTWFFRDKKSRLLGYYSITYEDGFVYSYPIEFGYNIGDKMCDFAPMPLQSYEKNVEDEGSTTKKGVLIQPPAACAFKDRWIEGVTTFADAYPVRFADGIRTVYATTLKNRYPGVAIKDVKFYLPMDHDRNEMPYVGEVVIHGIFV